MKKNELVKQTADSTNKRPISEYLTAAKIVRELDNDGESPMFWGVCDKAIFDDDKQLLVKFEAGLCKFDSKSCKGFVEWCNPLATLYFAGRHNLVGVRLFETKEEAEKKAEYLNDIYSWQFKK